MLAEKQKIKLAEEIIKDVVAIAGCQEKSVSVAVEEIEVYDWAEKVYQPDIFHKKQHLYNQLGYNPFEGS